jgi:hypothetical protein
VAPELAHFSISADGKQLVGDFIASSSLTFKPHTDQSAGVQGLALQNCPRAHGGPKETAE